MKSILYYVLIYIFVVCECRRIPNGFEFYLINIVEVVDGDTIMAVRLNSTEAPFKVKLVEIASPKLDQSFGIAAKEHLTKLVNKYKKSKVGISASYIHRTVYGILYMGRRNINKKMVSDGYAWCYRNKCPFYYKGLLKIAKFRKIGLWSEKYPTPPWEWNKTSKFNKSTKASASNKKRLIPVRLSRVIDGDTVYVTHRNSNNNSLIKVRMTGIDSPEMKQSFGPEARNHLETILYNLPKDKLSLIIEGIDKYKRTLGIIMSGSVDVNKQMVIDGYAWCYRHTQCPKSYKDAMEISQKKKKGLFIQKSPVTPWDWRKQQKN